MQQCLGCGQRFGTPTCAATSVALFSFVLARPLAGARCAECGVQARSPHHAGCSADRCPRCGGASITCRCRVAELGTHWRRGEGK